jgi:hypothetical protein
MPLSLCGTESARQVWHTHYSLIHKSSYCHTSCTLIRLMDPQFDRGNLKIPEMYADWLISTGGGTAGMCLHFQDGLLCEGVPSPQTMWSLTALRCSELPLFSLATICRIKARSDFSCTFAQHIFTIFSCVTFNFYSQTSVPSIWYLIGLCRPGSI